MGDKQNGEKEPFSYISRKNLLGKKVYNSNNINRKEQRKINTSTNKLTNKQKNTLGNRLNRHTAIW